MSRQVFIPFAKVDYLINLLLDGSLSQGRAFVKQKTEFDRNSSNYLWYFPGRGAALPYTLQRGVDLLGKLGVHICAGG